MILEGAMQENCVTSSKIPGFSLSTQDGGKNRTDVFPLAYLIIVEEEAVLIK